jgi:hypothetical protein
MGNGPYDVLGPHWGLGMPYSWFDSSSLSALLTGALTKGSAIDQLVLGWDGEEVDAWEAVRTVLRAKGYFPTYTATGLLAFARARLPSVLDLGSSDLNTTKTSVSPIPYTLRRDPALNEGIDRIVAIVGKTPWFDGDRIEVNTLSDIDALEPPNSLRQGLFGGNRNELELDLSVLAPRDLETAAYDLVAYAAMRGISSQTIYIRANDPGTIDGGDIIQIGDPGLRENWFRDENGDAIAFDDSAKWFGQVVGFKRNLMDATIDLEVVTSNVGFTRLRAPSAVFASTPGSNPYTFEASAFGGGPKGNGSDAEQFSVDMVVELYNEAGAIASGTVGTPDVQTITAVSGNTITLDAAFTTAPIAGDILRLARLGGASATGYPPEGVDVIDGGTDVLAYVWASDDSDTIGQDNDDAHIYGFGAL